MRVILFAAWAVLAMWCVLVIAARRRRRRVPTSPQGHAGWGAAALLVCVGVGVAASIDRTWQLTGLFFAMVLGPVIGLINRVRDRRAGPS
jgi:4-amino-4-deoxy-L-arabinose transferase-like glycosyltransferase